MFEYYRKKNGPSLCYKILAERVRNYNWKSNGFTDIVDHYNDTYVVLQTGSHDPWFISTKQFLEEWEGVEDKDLPPAYRK
jgi:hypothetical protein